MISKKLKTKRTGSWTEEVHGHEVTFRLMAPADRDAVLDFTSSLSHEDVIFLRMDITRPEVIEEWIANLKRHRVITLLAEDKAGKIIGYASLYHNEILWTRHQGEIRLFVLNRLRGLGLGKRLVAEIVHIAEEQDLEMLIVNIPRDQPHVRQMLERMGFNVDALLSDWLMDQDGNTHDLIVMSHRLDDYSL